MNRKEIKYPIISVLLAVRNEEKFIEDTLNMLFEQDYPQDKYEVIITDGMSDDGSIKIIKKFTKKYKNCFLYQNTKILSAAGWNLGIEKSRGEVLSFLSGHVLFEKSYYRKLVEHLNKDICGIGCPTISRGKSRKGNIISLATRSIFGNGGASYLSDESAGEVDSIVYGCYWKQDIESVGGFDENCVRGQDWDLNTRLRSQGYKLYKINSLRSEYFVRDTFYSLWRRQYLAGLWKTYINRKYHNAFRLRHLIPAIFAIIMTVTMVCGAFLSWMLFFPLLVLFIYMIISIRMTLRYKKRFNDIFLFVLVFFILHYAYGIGFVFGLGKHEK